MTNRRNFLKATGLGMLAASVPGIASASKPGVATQKRKYPFDLGVASFTLREFSTLEALDMTARLNIKRITFKDMHLPLNADAKTIADTVALCMQKGITLYGAGVIKMSTTEQVDNAFRYAKEAGMEMIIGVPAHALLEYVEKKTKEYNIKLAIHNHGPKDLVYPTAQSAYERIKGLDPRMGLCIDIGHTKRYGEDPEQDLIRYFERVHDIHIKDVTAASEEGTTCEIGRGVIDIPSFLKTVIRLGYNKTLALEYEKDGSDPLPGMAESVGYIRGVLDTI